MWKCILKDGFSLSPPIMSQEHRQPSKTDSSNKAACIRLLLVNYHLQGVQRTLGVVPWGQVNSSSDLLQRDQMRKSWTKSKLLEIVNGFRHYGAAIFPDTHPKVRQILLLHFSFCTGQMTTLHRREDCFGSLVYTILRKPTG